MRDQAKAKQSKFIFESLEEEPREKHLRFLMRTTALVACVAAGRRTRVNHYIEGLRVSATQATALVASK